MKSAIKHCAKCQAETERYKNGKCKPCVKAYNSKWYEGNADYFAKWRAENTDSVKASQARYRAGHKDEKNEYNAAWRAANPEKIKALNSSWYKKNRHKIKAKHAAWCAANKEKIKDSHSAWVSANLEKCRVYNNNRRAKTRIGGKLSVDIKEKLFALQKGKCACGCKQPLGDDYHLDHIMPLSLGGSNTDNNIQLLRATCNLQKSRKHPIDFMRQRGYLL